MKSILKIHNLDKVNTSHLESIITSFEGVIAMQIMKKAGEVVVIYDPFFLNEEKLKDEVENEGYTII